MGPKFVLKYVAGKNLITSAIGRGVGLFKAFRLQNLTTSTIGRGLGLFRTFGLQNLTTSTIGRGVGLFKAFRLRCIFALMCLRRQMLTSRLQWYSVVFVRIYLRCALFIRSSCPSSLFEFCIVMRISSRINQISFPLIHYYETHLKKK
jgi:hypothetical protein